MRRIIVVTLITAMLIGMMAVARAGQSRGLAPWAQPHELATLLGVARRVGPSHAPDSIDVLTADAATETMVVYFKALDRSDFVTAYKFWTGGVRVGARAVSYEEFAARFANIASIEATIGAPLVPQAEAAILVPVAIVELQHDQRLFLTTGCYILIPVVDAGSTRWAVAWSDTYRKEVFIAPVEAERTSLAASCRETWVRSNYSITHPLLP